MSRPVAAERLVSKPTNLPQPGGSRDCYNILPLLVSFEDVFGNSVELPLHPAMLVDLPHTY